MGAGRRSQTLAALVLAISGWLGAGHLDETTTYDIFFWTLAIWLLMPLLDDHEATAIDRWRWLGLMVLGR